MHPGSDSMGATSGFSARRPNAQSLPTFELPPPSLSSHQHQQQQQHQHQQKYPYSNGTQASGTLASVGNLLTPPSTIGGESSAGSTASSVAPYAQNGGYSAASWSPSTANSASYGFQQGGGAAQHSYQPQQQSHRGSVGSFSPLHHHNGGLVRGTHPASPATTEGSGMQPGSYEVSLPPFPTSGSGPMSAPPTLATMAPPQQQQHQGSQSQQQNMMSAPSPVSSTGPPHPSPIHAQDQFRAPSNQNYYSSQPSNNPQQSPYQYSAAPPQHSPLSAGGPMSRPQMSPASASGPIPPLSAPPVQSPHYAPRPYGPPYQTHGPVLSNLQNPSGAPVLMGGLPPSMMHGFTSGHAAAGLHMYGGGPPGTAPGSHTPQSGPGHNDRPFKCDQCPQSFNRNHDLKRHKRIHLAVKPFPCGHCDKSFSRKDALKRHILVKGCGKSQASGADADKREGSQSPANKSASKDTHDVKSVSVGHS
ncbi:hypothetical protein EJ06DRAFT_470676 [Trichodelitschia bisporula]|uniref:C2H2-type domain-containing protein n=1 Tax=Trichodelitschia bisporula TaxID=703511 RepID=A0A6G1I7W7_9PEZI|nr:hypothetical protein EJ06DRAFT_470676 [Trichodelitschia bisporula]